LTFSLVATLSVVARAQDPAPSADDEWKPLPVLPEAPPVVLPPPEFPSGEPLPPPAAPPIFRRRTAAELRAERRAQRRAPKEPNTVSLFGGLSLGQWERSEALYVGFPSAGVRFSLGVLDSLDLGVAFDSMYSLMNELKLTARWQFAALGNWAFAVAFEGGGTFFRTPAVREPRGSRYLSGRRNFGLMPGLAVSWQRGEGRGIRWVVDLRYLLAVDTEPVPRNPLGGVPPAVTLGHNAWGRIGFELPVSTKTAFFLLVGIEIHGRPEDIPAMLSGATGVVTSF
jgi:hypothetical protein